MAYDDDDIMENDFEALETMQNEMEMEIANSAADNGMGSTNYIADKYHFAESVRSKWARPPLSSPINPSKDNIVFQQLDMDYYLGVLKF